MDIDVDREHALLRSRVLELEEQVDRLRDRHEALERVCDRLLEHLRIIAGRWDPPSLVAAEEALAASIAGAAPPEPAPVEGGRAA